jgi:hypothetical protein
MPGPATLRFNRHCHRNLGGLGGEAPKDKESQAQPGRIPLPVPGRQDDEAGLAVSPRQSPRCRMTKPVPPAQSPSGWMTKGRSPKRKVCNISSRRNEMFAAAS